MNLKNGSKRIKQLCIIAGIIIIPLAYSLFYLGAFWDPYSRLDKLPVAVVNEDGGATIDGKARNLGNEMVDEMKADDSLKWAFTDRADGKAGVDDSKYYAMIVIPQTFSADIASAEGTVKKTALLTYEANEKRNFLASQILNRAVLELEEKARADVNRELTEQLSGKLKEVPGKLQELNDGIGDMQDGSKKLDDGAADLNEGAAKLDDGAGDLKDGAGRLDAGAGDLKNGAAKLDNGAADLKAGAAKLDAGAAGLKDGAGKVDAGAAGLASGANALNQGVDGLQAGAKDLSDNMGLLDAGIAQADAGAKALAQGAAALPALTKGASDVDAGAVSLEGGVDDYVQGVNDLIGQSEQVAAALSNYVSRNPAAAADPVLGPVLQQLASSGGKLDELKQGGTDVKNGIAQLKGGADQLKQGTTSLAALTAGAQQLAAATAQLKDGSAQLYTGSKTLLSGVNHLKAGSAALASGATELKSGTSELKNGASDLKNGTSDLKNGATDLKGGTSTLKKGATDLKNGTSDLKSGATDLKDGTSDLKGGTTDLKDGTQELVDGVGTARQKVNDAIGDANTELQKTDGLGDFAAEPVKLENTTTNSIPNYGTAFAPYFMSLSLWVGAIILFVGIYLDPDNRFPMLSRSSSRKLARVGAFAMISLIQSCLLAFLVIHVLHLQVHDPLAFYLTCVLVAMVFTSVVEFLIVNLGDIGKFLAIIFLVLQLTACGGTFPMETVPGFFNAIYRFMPMTYSVNLLKEAISGVNLGNAAHDVVVLVSIFAVFTAGTIGFSLLRKNKARMELPELTSIS